MQENKLLKCAYLSLIFASVLSLAACGGGGGGSDNPPDTTQPPEEGDGGNPDITEPPEEDDRGDPDTTEPPEEDNGGDPDTTEPPEEDDGGDPDTTEPPEEEESDDNAPSASITEPESGSSTESDQITIRGTASDESQITTVRVNGIDAASDDDFATWSATVLLETGMNTFTVETVDELDNSDSAAAEIVVERQDLAPDDFSFTSVSEAALNALVESDAATISGISHAAPVSVMGGEYAIDGGSFVSGDGSITDGQTLTLRLTSDASPSETREMTVAVGNAEQTFTVTTLAPESDPPESGIVFPMERSLTERGSLVVRGTAWDNSGIASVEVNGSAAIHDPQSGSWQADVPLSLGDNTLTATIIDNQDNQSTHTVAVRRSPLGRDLSNVKLDPAGPRLLAFDYKDLVAIDRATGNIDVISGREHTNLFAQLRELAVSADGTRALVLESDSGIDAIKEVDLLSGERTTISEDDTAEPAGTYHTIYDLALDRANNKVYIADSQGLIELDLASGSRSETLNLSSIRALVWDADNSRLLLNGYRSIRAFYPESGSSQVLSNNGMAVDSSDAQFSDIKGIAFDAERDLVYAVNDYDEQVIEVDLATGSRSLVSDNNMAVDESEVAFNLPGFAALDRANNRLYVTDSGRVVSVDIDSGVRTVLFQGLGEAQGIHFDAATSTILVLSRWQDTLYSFVLGDTEPTVISDNSTSVAESNTQFGDAWALAVDLENDLAYVGDWETETMFTVDLNTGSRSLVSDNSDFGDDDTLINPVAMVWMEAQQRVLVLDRGRRAIIDIDTATSERSTLTSALAPSAENALRYPTEMLLSPETGELLVWDKGIPAVVSVNPTTGSRSVYGSVPNDYRTSRFYGMELNQGDDSLLLYSNLYGVSRLNSDLSYEFLLSGNIRQIVYDGDVDEMLALESFGSSAGSARLVRLDLSSAAREILTVAPAGGSAVPINRLADVVVHPPSGAAYVVDEGADRILRVSLADGERTLFADNTIAQATSTIDFERMISLAIDPANNRLLVGDGGHSALISVDLASGSRTLIADDTVAADTSDVDIVRPGALAVDSAGEVAYVLDRSLNAVIRVDLDSGERTLITDNSTAAALSDIDFSTNPVDIGLDEARDRVLVTDQGSRAAIAVDLATGARTVFFDEMADYIAIDESSNRAIILDDFFGQIYSADLETGEYYRINAPTSMLIDTFEVTGADFNAESETLLFTDDSNARVVSVDIQTGERVVLSQ